MESRMDLVPKDILNSPKRPVGRATEEDLYANDFDERPLVRSTTVLGFQSLFVTTLGQERLAFQLHDRGICSIRTNDC